MNSIAAAALTVNPKAASKQENTKGSIGNRVEYGLKQGAHLYKTKMKDQFITTAGVAATAGATAAVAKSKTAQNAIINAGKKILNNESVKNTLSEVSNFVKPYATKALTFVKSNPKAAAAMAVVASAGYLITDIAVNINRNKAIYKAGKIDQEYTDKAKVDKLLA